MKKDFLPRIVLQKGAELVKQAWKKATVFLSDLFMIPAEKSSAVLAVCLSTGFAVFSNGIAYFRDYLRYCVQYQIPASYLSASFSIYRFISEACYTLYLVSVWICVIFICWSILYGLLLFPCWGASNIVRFCKKGFSYFKSHSTETPIYLRVICGVLSIILMIFPVSYTYTWIMNVYEDKENYYMLTADEQYAVIYSNSEFFVLERASCDFENSTIMIDTSEQKVIKEDLEYHYVYCESVIINKYDEKSLLNAYNKTLDDRERARIEKFFAYIFGVD